MSPNWVVEENCRETLKLNGKKIEFEDNFRSKNESDDSVRLPDSEIYLNRLENRLKKVKGLNSRKNLMEGLKEARESVMVQLTDQSSNVDFEFDQENNTCRNEIGLSYIEQKLFPDKVAINTEELLHLVKADVLQKITEMSNDQM